MSTDVTGLLEGPEMDALRELRSEVEGPDEAQRQAAWERVQGARSQAGTRTKGRKGGPGRGGRPWIVAAAAAVAVGVVAAGIGIAVSGDSEDRPAPPASTATTPTNPNPTPFETGRVWEPQSAADKKVMDTYRRANIHLLGNGGVRIDIPEEMDGEPMTRALNAEGIPVRFWAVAGEPGTWDTAREYPIDPDGGVDMSKEPTGTPYPKDRITAEHEDGPGSRLVSLTFDEVPTEPVDIEFTQ